MVQSEGHYSTSISRVEAALLRVQLFFQQHEQLSRFILKSVRDVSLFTFTCGVLYGINANFFTSDISSGRITSLVPFICIFSTSYIFGEVGSLINVPRILSMIIGGIILGNTTNMVFNSKLSFITRNIAFCTILIEGGSGLDPNVLRNSSRVCMQLCFVPLVCETMAAALIGYFVLELPPLLCVLLGFTLSAACAAIIVPSMLMLQNKSIGTEKGIPSMVIAASSMDDVMAIAGFGIILGYAFPTKFTNDSNTDHIWTIVKGPVEIIAGVATGYLFGTLIGAFPIEITCAHLRGPEAKMKIELTRTALMLLASLASIFVSETVELAGIGPLSVLVGSYCAALKLRKIPGVVKNVNRSMHVIWSLMAPFLFGILGAEFRTADILATHVRSAVFLAISSALFRLVTTYLSLYGSDLNPKEKFFISISWLAKGAVQATLAPIVYEQAVKKHLEAEKGYGKIIQTIAVISVLVTSPIAIIGMKYLPRHCLKMKLPGQPSTEQPVSDEVVNPRSYLAPEA